jgi:osmotically-inducible protein OsmY
LAEVLLAQPGSFERESDRRIFLALRRRLWEYEALRATRPELDLQVHQGIVRVRGRVRTQAMKEIAGYLLAREEGVNAVENELISDTEVIRDVADALALDEELAPLCLVVDARAGIATLSGELPDPALEQRAVEAAAAVPSVVSVISNLQVRRRQRPPTAPAARPAEVAEAETTAAPEQAAP